jgi:O-succinylbenzoic acid--CoA ligase
MWWDWLRRQAQLAPHHVYWEEADGSVRLTFGAMDERADRVAGRLRDWGVQADDRVAVLLEQGWQWAELFWALIRLGAVLVPLNVRLTDGELADLLARVAPRLLIADAARAAVPFGGRRVSLPNGLSPEHDPLLGEPAVTMPPGPDRLQSIIFTSGTTGRPKGARLTLGQHAWNAFGSLLRLGHATDDTWLLCMPLYHVGGQAILLRAALGGHPIVHTRRFVASEVAGLMASGRITMVSLVPTMLHRVLDVHPGPFSPRLRAVLVGGAACPPALAQAARARGLPVALTYGMTETGSQMATEEPGQDSGGVGRPLFGVELRIADPDADGVGEIRVRGPQVTSGYWDDPEATRQAFDADGWFRTGDLGRIDADGVGEIRVRGPQVTSGYWDDPEATRQAFDADGWFRTGDLGWIDADGVLHVLDRRTDLVVSGGENVYPAEVEAVLAQHPAVREAAVRGVPDEEWGQLVAAWVVLADDVSWDELAGFCRERLASYKVPRRWFRSTSLPRTATGKLQRRLLAADPGGSRP